MGALVFEIVVREPGWRARQPGVDDRLSQCLFGDDLQLDENGGVPLEVRNGEEGMGIRREHSLFLRTVKNADGEDRPAGHRRIAEARVMSALLNGRSQANPLPPTNQVRWP